MFKLLTDEERQKVVHEYNTRRAIVTLWAFILVLIAGIIGLWPSYILSNARENEVLERTKITEGSERVNDGKDLQAWLTETNNRLKLLSPELDTDKPSMFITQVLEQKVADIQLTGFSWVKVKGKVVLSVNGIALDRQALVSFERKVSSSGYFSEVTLPISNLAQDKDINFQIKFAIATSTKTSSKQP